MRNKMVFLLCLPWALLALSACRGDKGDATDGVKAADPAFLADHQIWRNQRLEDLLQPDGWTTLVGMHWLELKAHYIGSGTGSGIRLAVGPERLGMVQQDKGRVFFTPEAGTQLTLDGEPFKGRVELRNDHDPSPNVIGFDEGKGLMSVIERGGRQALRLKHADAITRSQFAGLEYWPVEASWKVEGKFTPHPPGKTIPIVDIIGVQSDLPNPGTIDFTRDGQTYRMEALAGQGGDLFVVLADRTSGHGSYPAGRFLDVGAPVNGKVSLDFNRAYNPPCAFTRFATCPLPPPENRLDLFIEAGEKTYKQPDARS